LKQLYSFEYDSSKNLSESNDINKDMSFYPILNNCDLLGALLMIYNTTPKEQVNMELLKYNEHLLYLFIQILGCTSVFIVLLNVEEEQLIKLH